MVPGLIKFKFISTKTFLKEVRDQWEEGLSKGGEPRLFPSFVIYLYGQT